VADTIPQEIYNIPPESPKHNTTYVYVTGSDSETVTTAQTAGYTGVAVASGISVVVYGTGYYYSPYYYWGPMYPYPLYWGYPYHAYGAAAWYNPATGFYGRGAVAYGPYGGYGRAAAYNPVTGTYARRAGAYGPYQAATAGSFYNPRTGAYGGGYRYANPYQGWGQGVVGKGDQWARGGYYYDERGAIGGIQTSGGGKMIAAGNGENSGMIARSSDGDLYVGKNGEIYKRDQSGNWQQRGDGGWSSANPPTQAQQQRINDAKAERSGQTARPSQQGGTGTGTTRDSMARPSQQPSAGQYGGRTGGGVSEAQRDQMRSMDREASARARGNQNAGSYNRSQSMSRSSGSYGGSRMGGGMRGGGGRRR
jgi:hypothetical protein